MIELIKKPNIDFMGKRFYAFALSGLLVLLGLVALVQIWRGHANLGVDFAGGTAVQMRFAQPVSLNEVRAALERAGIKDFDLQDLPTENKVLIRAKRKAEATGLGDAIAKVVIEGLPEKNPAVDSQVEIGPKVGSRLRNDAIVAIIAATIGILIYIAFRFQFKFSVGATIATFHDVLAVLGIFFALGKEINLVLVSALLMIAGYSLTDTVVVFDRIRENLKKRFKETVEQTINRSINEVLSRTIIVSFTTLLSALALFLFGGEVIHDFSLAIILGIVVGTYSSIFIASPTVLALGGGKSPIKK